MKKNRQIILDTETTGLYANNGDRIIEFAGLEMISRKLTGNYCHFYINPQCDINEEASKIHGISLTDLQDKPVFAEVGETIHQFINGAELIIHNAPFDVGFLNMEFTKIGLPKVNEITFNIVDTLVEAKKLYPGKRNSLDALCERLEIDRSKRTLHGALIDCDLLAKVYLMMTYSQFSLDIGIANNQTLLQTDLKATNYSKMQFKVIEATAIEQQQHSHYLDELEKINQQPCLYHKETN